MGVYTETILNIRSHDTEFIEQLYRAIKPKPKSSILKIIAARFIRRRAPHTQGLMEYLLPMPKHLENKVTNGYSGRSPEWRQWRIEQWGSPMDVWLDFCERVSRNELSLRFTSYNGMLITGIRNASERYGFTFKLLYYCDHGGVGHCTEARQTDFDFPEERPPADAGIPNELIEAFDLNHHHAAYMDDR